jgi:transposase
MKPWKKQGWVIPPEGNGDFVAAMEHVLDVYKRPYDPKRPVVCMDETPRQLIKETRTPIPAAAGRLERYDYEYERCGVFTVFMANEPLAGKRMTKVSERKTKSDWAAFIRRLEGEYPHAEKIALVMDNLSTHKAGSLYEAFSPEEAKRIMDRFEFVYTPKHGSWLNMAEIELNVMISQCLNRRMDSLAQVEKAVSAWQRRRDNLKAKVNWHFTTEDARVKLHRLYPTLEK